MNFHSFVSFAYAQRRQQYGPIVLLFRLCEITFWVILKLNVECFEIRVHYVDSFDVNGAWEKGFYFNY